MKRKLMIEWKEMKRFDRRVLTVDIVNDRLPI